MRYLATCDDCGWYDMDWHTVEKASASANAHADFSGHKALRVEGLQ